MAPEQRHEKLIAKTAWHHDGDISFFRDLVDTLVEKGGRI